MEAVEAVETVESLAAVARSRVTEYAVMLISESAKKVSKADGDHAAWVYTGPLPSVGDEITLEEFGGGASVQATVTAVERAHPFPIKATRAS